MSNQQSAISNQQRRQGLLLIAGCWLLAAGLSGCALLEPLRPDRSRAASQEAFDILDDGYTDVAGVIHIHTNYSHDAHGSFADVVRVANAQGLQYAVITDHNTLRLLREGQQGWHGAVLVLIGTELSTRGGHYLALNITQEIDRHAFTTQQIIDEVNRQGGFGFIAHPYFTKARWTDWTVRGFTGIETYNVAHDTLDENKLRLAMWTLFSPATPFYLSILDRPYDPLSAWDHLIASRDRPIVGIGSSDAHEFHVLGLKFAPYEDMFRLARTNVLIPEATVNAELVYEALRRGHAYASIDLVADARGFTFFAEDGRKVLGVMGDEVAFEPHLQLTALLPAAGHMVLYKDGASIATTTGRLWHVPVSEPGVYRLEAFRHNTPWIFSNPIYIKAANSNQQTADSDHETHHEVGIP